MIEITPIEFEQGDYRRKVDAGECIVWYRGSPVDWVEKSRRTNGSYDLHHDDGGDYSRLATVGAYEVCLTIEDVSDLVALRQRLKELAAQIVDVMPDNNLIYMRERWQEELDWQKEDARP